MPSGEVHWHEGMFLRPHHFLTEHRRMLRLMQLDGKWDLHHNWGLRAIALNTEALSNFRFSVSSLKARLRDGTLVEVPEDGPLPDLDLKPAFESNRKVTVLPGRADVQVGSAQRRRRTARRGHALLLQELCSSKMRTWGSIRNRSPSAGSI